MPIRAVVFDLFDTLVDLRLEDFPRVELGGRSFASSLRVLHGLVGQHAEVGFDDFAETLFEVDRELRASYYDRHVELPSIERFRAIVERLGVDAPSLPAALTDAHMGLFRRHTSVPDHHDELLSALRREVKIGLCSNFTHAATARDILDASGLAAHLETTVISETHGRRKPHREIFESVLEGLGVRPEEAVHVGDSLKADVGGAAPLGLRTVWITRRVGDPDEALREHAGPVPEATIGDLCELPVVLDRFRAGH